MVLDSKVMLLRQRFSINKVSDWGRVTPAQVLGTPGVAEATLNHLRLHLASHGITLQDDQTPKFWQSKLYETKLGTLQVSEQDRSVVCPFTVIVDSQEKYPYEFAGFLTDDGSRPIIVTQEVRSLGASHGDYSMIGFEGECHVERKSIEDARSTILGWGDRRERFESTLEFLSQVWMSAVVVEAPFHELIASAESRGKKSAKENQRILFRQVIAWQIDYQVPWVFCQDRRMAELATFRIMRRCFAKRMELEKQAFQKAQKKGELN